MVAMQVKTFFLRKILVEYLLVLCLGREELMGNHHACFQKLPSLQRDSEKFQPIIIMCLKINLHCNQSHAITYKTGKWSFKDRKTKP